MMAEEQKLCMGCMSPLESGASVCPHCGYNVSSANYSGLLATGSVVAQRYIVGRVLRRDVLSVTYIGFDPEEERRVLLEEFFPSELAGRAENGELTVVAENQTRFRTLMSDINDLWKRLARIESRGLLPVYDIPSANGTVYCISQYRECITLAEELEGGKTLPWSDARTRVMPVFTVVARLHNSGFVHGGISPENIYSDANGSLYLSGFSLPELHTMGETGRGELFAGYSAPEQYSKAGWQGEWTDIYALGALLYRVLTGAAPNNAPARMEKDTLITPKQLLPDIPENVSAAVLKALSVDKSERFQSVNKFTAALLEEKGSNTAVYQPKGVAEQTAALKNMRLLTIVLGALLAISIIFNIVQLSPSEMQEPSPVDSGSSSSESSPMNYQFIGMYLPTLQENLDFYTGITIKYLHGEHDEVPRNVVYDQSVHYGEPMPEDGIVTLYVSDGPSYVLLPELRGYTIEYARDKLTELNVFFEVRYVRDDTIEGENNSVVDMSEEPGTKLNTKTSENPSKVTLTVKTTEVVSGN